MVSGRGLFTTDPTPLMRFIAATAKPHRIHYVWPHTTRVEGYPWLVVHGPLSTLLLTEALRFAAPSDDVCALRHRNPAPLFCGHPARLIFALADDSASLPPRLRRDPAGRAVG
ncbi:hypothetical protein CFI00_17015 [Nocardioides sp. S5]|nr:hypothetical protein CFI00_17015 [Nocardioides sp. S5]